MKKYDIGFYPNLSNEDYHADKEYDSSSTLKLMLKSPRDYYEQRILGNKKEMSGTHLDFGSYIHSLILEPHLTEEEFAVYPGATRRGKEYEVFKEVNKGKIIMNSTQHEHAMNIMKAYEENKYAKYLLPGIDGRAEHTLFTELDGIKVKVRADYYDYRPRLGVITDVKTTSEPVTMRGIQDTIDNWDYDLSAALYVDAYEHMTGEPQEFYWLFLCKMPIGAKVVRASAEMLENGRKKYKDAIKMLKKARETGTYFEDNIVEVPLRRAYKYESIFGEENER